MTKLGQTMLVVATVAMLPVAAPADTLVLRDGRTVSGVLEGAGRQVLQLRVGERLEQFRLAEVESIRFSPRPARPSVPARPKEPLTRATIEGSGLAQVIRPIDQAQ